VRETRSTYKSLVVRSVGKQPVKRTGWDDNIKMKFM